MPLSEGTSNFTPNANIISPGTFFRENDLSGVTQGVENIGGAIVAPFPKGIAFSPVLLTSVADLEARFGIADGIYYGPYTAKEYLNEKGNVMVVRVGSLTGYKQNYPYVVWAVKGTYNRNTSAGVIDSGSSYAYTPGWASTSWIPTDTSWTASMVAQWSAGSPSGSGDTWSGSANVYLSSLTVKLGASAVDAPTSGDTWTGSYTTLGAASGSVLYSAQTITLTNLTASGLSVTASATLTGNETTSLFLVHAIASGSFTSSWTGTPSAATSAFAAASVDAFTGAQIYGIKINSIRETCAIPSLKIQGVLSGSFGKLTGGFTPSATPTFDECTNIWTTNGADNQVLAVLADTQNATISDLVAPGFSGSTWVNPVIGNALSSSITKDYTITLKSSTSTTAYGNYAFSLDSASPKYITNVFSSDATIGKPPTPTGQKIEAAYLYKIFENQITRVMAENTKWYISGSFLPNGNTQWGTTSPLDFTDDYSRDLNNGDSAFSITHATTPWLTSQAVASWDGTTAPTRFRLFKAHTLADGTYTNTSYKLEISNVKLAGQVAGSDWGSFTLTVRKYSDTDKKPVYLEQFQNCNLDPDSANYVARRIGDRYNYINFAGKIIEFGTYTNLSKYIRIEMTTTPYPISAVPAGFEELISPIDSSMGYWITPIKFSRASLYGSDPGKYPSGIAFNDAPAGADSELVSLYPTGSTGNGAADDNLQYFAPYPKFVDPTVSVGRNVKFALDQVLSGSAWLGINSTGSYLDAALSGSVPYIYDATNEATYVKMRKFIVGFQGGFDGQSPAIPINVGSDITAGNTQGLDCTDINAAGSIAYKQCIAALGNADEFDINLISLPGIVHQYHPYVTNLVVDMCETRGDVFYIMDLHVTPAVEGGIGQIDEVVTYADAYDTNYAAAYYPWVKILDTNTNKIITVPPSVVLPAIFAQSDKASAEWFAPAGLNRGGITQAVQVCDRTTHEERDTLYENRINPIAAFPGQGICVWGQKTLQNASSALDRISVRRLLINIKKYIASIGRFVLFEQNTSQTRNRFLSIVNPYMESIQQRSGLYAFQIVMDDSTNTPDILDRNILYGKIYLKPTKTAEFLVIDFNVMSSGASFPNA